MEMEQKPKTDDRQDEHEEEAEGERHVTAMQKFVGFVMLVLGWLQLLLAVSSGSEATSVPFLIRSEEHTSELQSPCNLVCRIIRSEKHTSELQSPCNLVCRLLLEKKKTYRFHEQSTAILHVQRKMLYESSGSPPRNYVDDPIST